jgi:hypothetical protein
VLPNSEAVRQYNINPQQETLKLLTHVSTVVATTMLQFNVITSSVHDESRETMRKLKNLISDVFPPHQTEEHNALVGDLELQITLDLKNLERKNRISLQPLYKKLEELMDHFPHEREYVRLFQPTTATVQYMLEAPDEKFVAHIVTTYDSKLPSEVDFEKYAKLHGQLFHSPSCWVDGLQLHVEDFKAYMINVNSESCAQFSLCCHQYIYCIYNSHCMLLRMLCTRR